MTQPTKIIKLCQSMVILSLIALCIFLFSPLRNSIQIETDLKAISPSIANQPKIQQAINAVSQSIEQHFTLVLVSPSEDTLDDAIDFIYDELSSFDAHFSIIDETQQLDKIKEIYQEHRFTLLSEERAEKLTMSDGESGGESNGQMILDEANNRLYSLDSSAQLFSIPIDPFGYLTEFLLEAGNTESSDDYIAIEKNGTPIYHAPLHFNMRGQALSLQEQKSIHAALTQIKARINENHPDIQFLHSGVVFFATDAATRSEKDISRISKISTIGILLTFLFIFRSLRALVLPLLSISFGLSIAFITCQIIFSSVHIITIVFGAGLIGVVIDYTLHYYYHLEDSPYVKNIRFYKALGLSLITSILGYAALGFSSLEALQRVAVFSSLGLIGAWIMVVAAGPLLSKTPYQRIDTPLTWIINGLSTLLSPLATRWRSSACCVITLIVAGLSLPGLTTGDSPRLFFNPAPEILEEELKVNQMISSFEPGNYLILQGQTPDEVYRLIHKLETATEGLNLFSVNNFVPSPEQQRRNYQALAHIYAEQGLAETFLHTKKVATEIVKQNSKAYHRANQNILTPEEFQQQMGSTIPLQWLTLEGNIYSFILIPKGSDLTRLEQFAKTSEEIMFIQTAKMAEQSISQQRQDATTLVFLGLSLIASLIFLRYRRLSKLTLLLIPITSIALTFSIFSILSVTVTLFHIMAIFLIIGLGMDYMIFVAELNQNGTHFKTMYAIYLSALTSALSFGLLSFSSLSVVSAFGLTVLIGNTCNLVGATLYSSIVKRELTT